MARSLPPLASTWWLSARWPRPMRTPTRAQPRHWAPQRRRRPSVGGPPQRRPLSHARTHLPLSRKPSALFDGAGSDHLGCCRSCNLGLRGKAKHSLRERKALNHACLLRRLTKLRNGAAHWRADCPNLKVHLAARKASRAPATTGSHQCASSFFFPLAALGFFCSGAISFLSSSLFFVRLVKSQKVFSPHVGPFPHSTILYSRKISLPFGTRG